MRKYWMVLLTVVLAAGCVSASVPAPSLSVENQERRIQKLLVGTWQGYIKDTSHARIAYNTPELQIFRVERTTNNGWFIDLSLNGKRINIAELIVNEAMIRIEFTELYANLLIFHHLDLSGDRRLVGKIWYGTRSFTAAEVTFDKID